MIGATNCWSSGSFMSPRLPLPPNPFVATVCKMLAAGLVLVVAGGVAGEFGSVRLSAMPAQAWVALVYLVLFRSLLAFSAYVWLLGNAPLSLTATYAYVNPVVKPCPNPISTATPPPLCVACIGDGFNPDGGVCPPLRRRWH